jgi:hypothetical protein
LVWLARNDAQALLPGVFTICGWKPVLMFTRGARRDQSLLPDVLRPSRRDKSLHPWAQGDGGIWPLIEHLTRPGELVVDPACGTAHWGELVAGMGRRYLGCDIIEPHSWCSARLSTNCGSGTHIMDLISPT